MTVRGLLPGGVGSRMVGVSLALAFLGFATGCGQRGVDGYDPALRYPLRTDLLVLQPPPFAPTGPAPAGRLDEAIAAFPAAGGQVLDPKSIPETRRAELTAVLEELFGTPANPLVNTPDRPGQIGDLDLSPGHLAAGSRVYRRLCNQCHGLSGDGRGPTGPWLYPHPRDFRRGEFKTGVVSGRPRIADLVRSVRQGVSGTSMPVFDLIPEEEVQAVTAYVLHLSLRGEVEFQLTKALLDDTGEADVSDLPAESRRVLTRAFDQWARAQGAPPVPEPPAPADAEAVRRGHRLFGTQGCASCHQDYGRAETYRYDVWGGVARVSDLTRAERKWGAAPADLAARVRHGIPAAGMPASPHLSDQDVQDLAAFVADLPYPSRLPADVREQVYPTGR